MKKTLVVLLAIILNANFSLLFAQSREFIRNAITERGDCRNVAITKTNGDIALFQSNAYATSRCPKSLNDALKSLNEDGEFIDDVQLTEDGRWLILYGENGIMWNDIPYSLENKLREYNEMGEVITSVTFNDAGNWIIITTNYYCSSHSEVTKWLKEGNDLLGQLWAACITDDAIVVVFEDGYRFLGNIPDSLKNQLEKTTLDVYRLKIAGNAWFFADKYGKYTYKM